MAYAPSLELDVEINQVSNTFYSSVMSLLHFGESELNHRKGERYNLLSLNPELVTYYNKETKQWNKRGIDSLDVAIKTINDFITTGDLSNRPVELKVFDDMKLRISEVLVETHLKPSDVFQLVKAFELVISAAAENGELGVITLIKDKLVELRDVRLSPTRGTEINSIPVWKLIGAIVIFGFPVFKSLRCLLRNRCCNTVSGLEGAIVFIAALAWTLC
jgi:hypothetical protein